LLKEVCMGSRHAKTKLEPDRVIDAPTVNGRPITLVTAPETREQPRHRGRDRLRFWDGAASFYEDWRREMDGAEPAQRVRFGRGTGPLDVERDTDADDDTGLLTAVNPALAAIDPPSTGPKHKRALSPTLEVDSEALDDVAPGVGHASASSYERVSVTAEQRASFEPSHSNWLGVATSQPQVGARLVIGGGSGGQFMLTSLVSLIITHSAGLFVQTRTDNRYFVAPSGDVFLVRWAPPTRR
jgi:hypothetical protein